MEAKQFWDDIFSERQKGNYSRVDMPDLNDPIMNRAMEHFGDVRNKTIIDLGCGRGATSLFFAHCGANVISIDLSEVAISNLSHYCQDNGIENRKACFAVPETEPTPHPLRDVNLEGNPVRGATIFWASGGCPEAREGLED